MKKLYSFIKHFHCSDAYGIDGEGVQIDDGMIDFPKLFSLFKDYKYAIIPEIWRVHLNNGKGFLIGLERLAKYIR